MQIVGFLVRWLILSFKTSHITAVDQNVATSPDDCDTVSLYRTKDWDWDISSVCDFVINWATGKGSQ